MSKTSPKMSAIFERWFILVVYCCNSKDVLVLDEVDQRSVLANRLVKAEANHRQGVGSPWS